LLVPRSRIRRRADFTPPTAKAVKLPGTTGRLVGPIALILLLLGLAWIVVFYLAGDDVPVMSSLGNWNLAIGMGLITAGFITLTRWK
jgi:Cell division protein CrgA